MVNQKQTEYIDVSHFIYYSIGLNIGQIQNLLKAEPTPDRSWDNCKVNATANANACTPTQKQLIKGIFILSKYSLNTIIYI